MVNANTLLSPPETGWSPPKGGMGWIKRKTDYSDYSDYSDNSENNYNHRWQSKRQYTCATIVVRNLSAGWASAPLAAGGTP